MLRLALVLLGVLTAYGLYQIARGGTARYEWEPLSTGYFTHAA